MNPISRASRMPVTIIAGFLGSGKTTLLNHILASQHGLKVAVIVNEIGAVGIDSELIIATSEHMVELSNGCICCSMNNDLVDAVFRVLDRGEKIDYLVLECTGVADPLPVVLTFLRSELRDLARVDFRHHDRRHRQFQPRPVRQRGRAQPVAVRRYHSAEQLRPGG
jgi:G3E family GTPase